MGDVFWACRLLGQTRITIQQAVSMGTGNVDLPLTRKGGEKSNVRFPFLHHQFHCLLVCVCVYMCLQYSFIYKPLLCVTVG